MKRPNNTKIRGAGIFGDCAAAFPPVCNFVPGDKVETDPCLGTLHQVAEQCHCVGFREALALALALATAAAVDVVAAINRYRWLFLFLLLVFFGACITITRAVPKQVTGQNARVASAHLDLARRHRMT